MKKGEADRAFLLEKIEESRGYKFITASGLKLLSVPRAPKELSVSALIRNTAEVEDWKLFLTS